MAAATEKADPPERSEIDALPRKKDHRARAHANPFADKLSLFYPSHPEKKNWWLDFPTLPMRHSEKRAMDDSSTTLSQLDVLDVGCGFGGLLFELAPLLPNSLIVGLELRGSVQEYVSAKIYAKRRQAEQQIESGVDAKSVITYQNIACIRANAMKTLPNFFKKGQLRAMFFCFPDPHFKARKHKARIISPTLNSEYAYVLRPGGMIYTITDVEDLHTWMVQHLEQHESFERVEVESMEPDSIERKCVTAMSTATEESQKVQRNGGLKLIACFRRKVDPPWPPS